MITQLTEFEFEMPNLRDLRKNVGKDPELFGMVTALAQPHTDPPSLSNLDGQNQVVENEHEIQEEDHFLELNPEGHIVESGAPGSSNPILAILDGILH